MVDMLIGGRKFDTAFASNVIERLKAVMDRDSELKGRVAHIPVYDYAVAPIILSGLDFVIWPDIFQMSSYSDSVSKKNQTCLFFDAI